MAGKPPWLNKGVSETTDPKMVGGKGKGGARASGLQAWLAKKKKSSKK